MSKSKFTLAQIDEILGSSVLFSEQTLTEEQKAQARANIGVGTSSDGSAAMTETWVFEMEDGTTVQKQVVVG